MTSENYRKYLLNQKEQGKVVVKPFKDEDRLKVYNEVFSEDSKKDNSKKSK